jgi:hypothetical protein
MSLAPLKSFYERVKTRRGAGRAIIAGAQVPGHHLSDLEEQVGVRGLSQFRFSGGRMTPLWALLPGIQASGSRCATRHGVHDSGTVLGVKGSLRRG